ncbi:MAG: alpha/beta hydrolase [Gammaproteobacteria bacterium]|nr:alpha/beta hydrolase [Gammaproteobacteria bacterium]
MDTDREAVFQHLRDLFGRIVSTLDDLPKRRRLLDEYFRLDGEIPDIVGTLIEVDDQRFPLEWVCADNADPDRRILYIHGGSWVSGSFAGYRALASRISKAAGAAVLLVDYRLAPEHRFPAGLDDCVEAFLWMLGHGPDGPADARNAFICGDSAGGNLALATLLRLQAGQKKLPDAVLALSPATDFTAASPSLQTNAGLDPIIHPMVYSALQPVYLGDADPRDPFASPIFGDFSQAPPILLQVGSAEVLLDDSVRLAEHAREQGCEVELQVWEGMPHVFQGFAPRLADASRALEKIGAFVRQHSIAR